MSYTNLTCAANVLFLLSAPQYRAWLRASYRPSPFKEQEQVEALLALYAEQQRQERERRGDQSWMNQASGVYPLPYKAYGSDSKS